MGANRFLRDWYQGRMFQAEDAALLLKAAGYIPTWARDDFVHRADTPPLIEQDANTTSLLTVA